MGWICFGITVIFAVCALGALCFVLFVLTPSGQTGFESMDCPRCTQPMPYKIRLPQKIRCSCGNIMPVPAPVPFKRTRDVKCPGCQSTIHVAPIHKPSRVRCRCGNIADLPK